MKSVLTDLDGSIATDSQHSNNRKRAEPSKIQPGFNPLPKSLFDSANYFWLTAVKVPSALSTKRKSPDTTGGALIADELALNRPAITPST